MKYSALRLRRALLDVQLFMVLAHGASFCCEGVEHHGRVDEIFLHTLQPRVQLLKPHQLSSIWGKEKVKQTCGEEPRPVKAFHSCEMNMATSYFSCLSFELGGGVSGISSCHQILKIELQQETGCTIMLSYFINKINKTPTEVLFILRLHSETVRDI